jgi:hypothetical protein
MPLLNSVIPISVMLMLLWVERLVGFELSPVVFGFLVFAIPSLVWILDCGVNRCISKFNV